MAKLNENEMWKASITCNSDYDGIFYYAVKTTKIVCRPSCKSKVPKRENVLFFTNLSEALQNGFHPCKRCRPDLGENYKPEMDYVGKARQILELEYENPNILHELPSRIGLSTFHFQRIFKKVTNTTPREYLQEIRLKKAEELLVQRELDNTDVGLKVGFKSLSCFYSAFRRRVGLSPGEYRKMSKQKGE